jgi:hypothetical protein
MVMAMFTTTTHHTRMALSKDRRQFWLLLQMQLLLFITLPLSSLGFQSSDLSSSSGTATPPNSMTVPVPMTTIPTKPIPKILCCSCDESTVFLVRQAFSDSPLPALIGNQNNDMNHTLDHHHRIPGDYFQLLHHVPTSQQALRTLLEHSEDTFSTIIVDDSTWDNGAVFRACFQRRLLPVRIFIETTMSVTDESSGISKSSTTIPQETPFLPTKDSSNKNNDRNHKLSRCYEMGADVVVPCSVTALQHAYQVLVKPSIGSIAASGSSRSNDNEEEQPHHDAGHPHSLQLRYQREAQLQLLSGGRVTRRIRELQRHTERLATCFAKLASTTATTREHSTLPTTTTTTWKPHCQLQSPLSYNQKHHEKVSSSVSSASPFSSSSLSLRIVHISDTHNFHRQLHLPPGDILLHTGDMCGNYNPESHNRRTMLDQFQDFLEWIHSSEVYPRYEKIVLLAGNHDTYLDPKKCKSLDDYQRAKFLLRDVWGVEVPSRWSMWPTPQHLLTLSSMSSQHHHPVITRTATLTESPSSSKVCYLDQSSLQFRGLTIYGSPTTICRVETQNQRMRSNGFERTHIERQQSWNQIPNKIDILLTHLPPAGVEGANGAGSSCEYLTRAVYHQRRQTGRDDGKDKDPDDTLRPLLPKNWKTARPQSSSTSNSKRPPRLHAFGHVHSQFGVAREPLSGTILSNASQERLLRDDLYGGGTPLIIDLPLFLKEEGRGGGTRAGIPES